jgi:hypothetical protein
LPKAEIAIIPTNDKIRALQEEPHTDFLLEVGYTPSELARMGMLYLNITTGTQNNYLLKAYGDLGLIEEVMPNLEIPTETGMVRAIILIPFGEPIPSVEETLEVEGNSNSNPNDTHIGKLIEDLSKNTAKITTVKEVIGSRDDTNRAVVSLDGILDIYTPFQSRLKKYIDQKDPPYINGTIAMKKMEDEVAIVESASILVSTQDSGLDEEPQAARDELLIDYRGSHHCNVTGNRDLLLLGVRQEEKPIDLRELIENLTSQVQLKQFSFYKNTDGTNYFSISNSSRILINAQTVLIKWKLAYRCRWEHPGCVFGTTTIKCGDGHRRKSRNSHAD